MTDTIIILAVAAMMVFAVKGAIRHFKGEGPCCGGGFGSLQGEIPEKKLSGTVVGKKIVRIEGMHCENCAKSVTEAINGLDGASARVSLREKKAVVSYDRPISDAVLSEAVEKAGFKVLSIET